MNTAQATDTVAGEVRAWMGRRMRSTRSAAIELGWTETYLGRRLAGRIPFNVAELARMAELLGVDVGVFFVAPPGSGVSFKDNRHPLRALVAAA